MYFSSVLAVSSVEVRGNHTVPQATVLRSAAVPTGTPLARVDTGAIADRVRQINAVADVRVSRSWPDRVVLTVTERAAVVAVTIGERFELVDAAGVSFRITDRRPDGLPQAKVSGPRRDVTLRSVVAVSAALPDQLRGRVRLISAASPDSISLDLDSGVKVVWGSAERSDRKVEVLRALMRRPADGVRRVGARSSCHARRKALAEPARKQHRDTAARRLDIAGNGPVACDVI